MYDQGHGVPQDYTKAREWWEKAAARGNAKAQFNLGVIYGLGQGVQVDEAKAREWFSKACENGHQRGCENSRKLDK